MAEEGPHGLLIFLHMESGPLLGETSPFLSCFLFSPHISSQKFSPSTFYSSSAKAAVWMLCEMLYRFLLLMPFSFGDRIALSVRCFLLSFIAEMDHPWPSLLSPCHMWKVPLPVMDITCLVEYCQNKFIWLSVIQNPLMYLHSLSLCAHTHTPHGEFFLSLHFPCSLGPLHWLFPEHRYLQTSANHLPQRETALEAHLCGKAWPSKVKV